MTKYVVDTSNKLGSWWNYGDCFSFSFSAWQLLVVQGEEMRLVVRSSWRERQPRFKTTLLADPRCNSLRELSSSSCALRRSHDIPLARCVDLMGAVVCGGWKGHSHAWEVVGIVASWGIVVGAEAACSSFSSLVSFVPLFISHTSTPSKTTTTTRWMNTYR